MCGYYKRRFGVEITPDQVASCAGSQEGVGHIGMVLCDEGDTVLLPTPCYPVFIAGSLLGGAKPWYYPLTKEHGFLPYVKDIPEDVARKAKYMIVSCPQTRWAASAPGAVRRTGGLCQKVRHSYHPRQRLQRHYL